MISEWFAQAVFSEIMFSEAIHTDPGEQNTDDRANLHILGIWDCTSEFKISYATEKERIKGIFKNLKRPQFFNTATQNESHQFKVLLLGCRICVFIHYDYYDYMWVNTIDEIKSAAITNGQWFSSCNIKKCWCSLICNPLSQFEQSDCIVFNMRIFI